MHGDQREACYSSATERKECFFSFFFVAVFFACKRRRKEARKCTATEGRRAIPRRLTTSVLCLDAGKGRRSAEERGEAETKQHEATPEQKRGTEASERNPHEKKEKNTAKHHEKKQKKNAGKTGIPNSECRPKHPRHADTNSKKKRQQVVFSDGKRAKIL
jgi:hypothetical protein